MPHPGIGVHALFGEVSAILFLWTFVELYRGVDRTNVVRVRRISLVALLSLALAWIVGGNYYLTGYQQIKDTIVQGPQPWSHLVFMEAKEHIFLFLPILAVLQTMTLQAQDEITGDSRYALLVITGLLVILVFLMAGMGYLISSGFRAATGPTTLLGGGF
ncbi:hypothetical protein [Halobacterium wangiae]|uniref:hypothetical protein n=1 Tax=Halobacterium wangiae TaxID=2902623 RepID=UPI001E37C002|nr:hypothetical protein [Halobacterium wangiae]